MQGLTQTYYCTLLLKKALHSQQKMGIIIILSIFMLRKYFYILKEGLHEKTFNVRHRLFY